MGIKSSHGKSNLMSCALRPTLLWAGEDKQERAGRLERRPISQPRYELIMWGQWE